MNSDVKTDSEGVLSANKRMLLEQIRTDICFIIKYAEEEERSIGCHRYVLCSRSHVFETMVYGAVPLSEETMKKGIHIADIPYNIFYSFLQFVYFGQLELRPDNVIPLLYTAKKYMVTSLEKHCSAYLQTLTKTENACLILDQSLLYDQIELAQTAKLLIQMNTIEALESDTFLDIRSDTLCELLSIESLSCSENEVFLSCLRWAESQLTKANVAKSTEAMRDKLKKPVKLIHFGGFSLKELSDTVVKSGLLTPTEYDELRDHICAKSTHSEGQYKVTIRSRYSGNPIRFLFKSNYGMMQRQAFKTIHLCLKPSLPIQLKRIVLDLKDYARSHFALTIHTSDNVYRQEVPPSGNFEIELSREVRVEADTEMKIELFVRSSLPITVTVQSELTAVTEVQQADIALSLDVTEASRGAGAVFTAVGVLPLAL